MKRFFAISGLIILINVILCGCGAKEGSGNMLTDIRDVRSYEKIKVSGVQRLILKQGTGYHVAVTADDNVIGSVVSYVNDGLLNIENRSSMANTDIDVEVYFPKISLLDVRGHVMVLQDGPLNLDNLELRLEGSGRIQLKQIRTSGNIHVFQKGSGNVWLAGEAQVFKVKSEGAGNVLAENLACKDITAKLMGPGSVFVTANGKLAVSVESSGSLIYSGRPTEIKKWEKGTGIVESRN